jgi:hypothetical protein
MPLNGRHPYDVSKSCTDLLATSYAHTYGLPATIARCGNIYGGGDLNWSRIVPGTIRSLLGGERPILRSDGRSIRDYVYVRDVVDAYITLAERAGTPGINGQAFNFSPQTRHSVVDIVDAIGSAMGVDPDPVILANSTMEIRDQTLDTTKARWGGSPCQPCRNRRGSSSRRRLTGGHRTRRHATRRGSRTRGVRTRRVARTRRESTTRRDDPARMTPRRIEITRAADRDFQQPRRRRPARDCRCDQDVRRRRLAQKPT